MAEATAETMLVDQGAQPSQDMTIVPHIGDQAEEAHGECHVFPQKIGNFCCMKNKLLFEF